MAVKALSVEEIVSKFPIKTFPPINGGPTHFPTKLSKGAQYYFVMYSYDMNAIIVYPIKDRSTKKLLDVYDKGCHSLNHKRVSNKHALP